MNAQRIRFRQVDYSLNKYREKLGDWDIPKRGCGATAIADILVNYGVKTNPIEITKEIITDERGNFDDKYMRPKGIAPEGLIYCLKKLDIDYEIVKIDFENPEVQRKKIIDEVKSGNMAIIHVGPKDGYEEYKGVFSKFGHYLVVSDVDEEGMFYVINSNETGDNQIGVPFSYETLIREIYGRKDSFNFLFIKRK